MDTNIKKIGEVSEAIDFYRGIVLDICEQAFESDPSWKYLRSRILKAFGDRGLEGRLTAILTKTNKQNN